MRTARSWGLRACGVFSIARTVLSRYHRQGFTGIPAFRTVLCFIKSRGREWLCDPDQPGGYAKVVRPTAMKENVSPKNALPICSRPSPYTEGHPDKVCDQISDAVLDAILAKEIELAAAGYVAPSGCPPIRASALACETMATTGMVHRSRARSRTQRLRGRARHRARGAAATSATTAPSTASTATPARVLTAIHEQSPRHRHGRRRGAGGPAGRHGDDPTTHRRGRPGHDVRLRLRRDRPSSCRCPSPWRTRLAQPPDRGAQGRHAALPAPRRQDARSPSSTTRTAARARGHRRASPPSTPPSVAHDADSRGHDGARHPARADPGASCWTRTPSIYVNPTGRFVIGGPHGRLRPDRPQDHRGHLRRHARRHGGGAFSGKDPTKVDRSRRLCRALRGQERRGGGPGRAAARCSWPTPSAWRTR